MACLSSVGWGDGVVGCLWRISLVIIIIIIAWLR